MAFFRAHFSVTIVGLNLPMESDTEDITGAIRHIVIPFDRGLDRACTEYGTDGTSVDMNWYTWTELEAIALIIAAKNVAETLGMTVVEADHKPLEAE